MFSYYGSKSKVVNYYPPPMYDTIIEPFAGSARYSLKYSNRNIILYDYNQDIVKIWEYLINVSSEEILSLPILEVGEDKRDYDLTEDQQRLMSYLVQKGVANNRNIVSNFGHKSMKRDLVRISKQINFIRHWKVYNDTYENIENIEATWFIDPPYQFGGHSYKYGNDNIDFAKLKEWCIERKGQVIVCENTKADWMNFKPLKRMRGTFATTMEAIWTNMSSSYNQEQIKLF